LVNSETSLASVPTDQPRNDDAEWGCHASLEPQLSSNRVELDHLGGMFNHVGERFWCVSLLREHANTLSPGDRNTMDLMGDHQSSRVVRNLPEVTDAAAQLATPACASGGFPTVPLNR